MRTYVKETSKSALLAFEKVTRVTSDRWIPRTKGQWEKKLFPFYDVIMSNDHRYFIHIPKPWKLKKCIMFILCVEENGDWWITKSCIAKCTCRILSLKGLISCPRDNFGIPFGDGPLIRYVKLRVAHAPGMPGTFFPPPRVSDPDMHHGTCMTHVPWCMPGSLIDGFFWSRWRGKRSLHSQRMRNPQFYVFGKGPMD